MTKPTEGLKFAAVDGGKIEVTVYVGKDALVVTYPKAEFAELVKPFLDEAR